MAASDNDTISIAAVWAISGEAVATITANRTDTVASLREELQCRAGNEMLFHLLLGCRLLNDSDILNAVGIEIGPVVNIQVLTASSPQAGMYHCESQPMEWHRSTWTLTLHEDGTCQGNAFWSSMDCCGSKFKANGAWTMSGTTVTFAWEDPSAVTCAPSGRNHYTPSEHSFGTAVWKPLAASLEWDGMTLIFKTGSIVCHSLPLGS
eukprot:gnl/TRDRNA2_/TRDRNA2_145806_c0_seq2.p1 gnl/TRDRNA2_/TRDRNA2_145806_c0~~gnl/TRDRNA2_/TRDRNA2_145806_c0_seq2.p1  ORF type:complete len:207 (+),score=18.64 gnl/TRDRNA2_/TRDRNA2_145806_c0_seq2:119-739(+)